MLRNLQSNEVPTMVMGGREFYSEGNLPGGFDACAFIAQWTELIETGVGRVIGWFGPDGTINGALGFVFSPDLFNGQKMACENFWFMRPEFRGGTAAIRLLKEYERQAREAGCRRCGMVHLLALQPEKLGKLYENLGYKPVEVNYMKEL